MLEVLPLTLLLVNHDLVVLVIQGDVWVFRMAVFNGPQPPVAAAIFPEFVVFVLDKGGVSVPLILFAWLLH